LKPEAIVNIIPLRSPNFFCKNCCRYEQP